jgi:MtN3 and saliva related transmembrane protein
MKHVDLLGWVSSFILLLTLVRQVYVQWQSESVAGVSKWLFVGQLAASTGYTIYSFLLHNWVYVCSNIAILLTAVLGEGLYLRNRRVARRRGQPVAGPSAGPPELRSVTS